MAVKGVDPNDTHTSPLSSDAETEPLPFDETGSDQEDDNMSNSAQHLGMHTQASTVPPAHDITPSAHDEDFSGDSELTEEPDSEDEDMHGDHPHTSAQPPFSDYDGSPLSEIAPEPKAYDSDHAQAAESLSNLVNADKTSSPTAKPIFPGTSSTLSSDSSQDDEQRRQKTQDSDEDNDGDATIRPPSGHRLHAAIAGKRRAAATGGAPSLLMSVDADSSAPPSATSSRQTSPALPEETLEQESVHEEDAEEADYEQELTSAESGDTAKDFGIEESKDETASLNGEGGADGAEGAEQDDVEANQRRKEALEMLTRTEIGFAMLRDRLCTERKEELEAETEMIHNGTHPELLLLHSIIDTRKERRLAVLQTWLEKEEESYNVWSKTEDKLAWTNWRDTAATQRRTLLEETNRKRRKLEREKRMLDTPLPVRRHQPFESELIRKPPSYSRSTALYPEKYAPVPPNVYMDDINSYVAYPDLRGLEEYDAWMDMEQMGIRPMPPMYPDYYRQEDPGMGDPYLSTANGPLMPGYGPNVPPHGMFVEGPYEPVYLDEYGRPPSGIPEVDAPRYQERLPPGAHFRPEPFEIPGPPYMGP
ncbi:NAPDH-dependent diflavin reductase [Malassezia vespertilionis]|uniref:Uncharacterized protein n=1 Tax=Malassezia vespertilionis TaxID=2020962 RepID=A0A2N1JED1_9BASI|nr:NAPDH-dependent diflavin reductase [Malassezia vespertilionis]PKI84902.1 hypothetical protein MVES_000819 [Malassezia vespertilionis]WFD05541.1 NAPDH-dependent diflavin reductase [Malassezia vespertilionis]